MILKLSHLQRGILAMLFQEAWQLEHAKEYQKQHGQKPKLATQREFNELLYQHYFGCDEDPSRLPSAKASLSRAFKRLEMQGMIKRRYGKWLLTDLSDGMDNGMIHGILQYGELVGKTKKAQNG
jgi:hypothetical protein